MPDGEIYCNLYVQNKTNKNTTTPGRKKQKERIAYKVELPNVIIDDIINEVNGGFTRLNYY